MTEQTILWSLRYSNARGTGYVAERQCAAETAQAWLAQYQADEPGVEFVLAQKRPRLKRAA